MRARLLAVALAAVGLAATARPAHATDILKLKSGDFVPGEVLETDDEGLLFARQQGGKIRIDWDDLLPISQYEVRAGRLAVDDAPGRLALAEQALGMKLYHQARKEALKAKGVGEAHEEPADALLARIARAEADDALAEMDELVAEGDPQAALERARAYLRVAPPGEDADRVRGRVPDLLVRMERAEADAKEAAEEAERQELSERKRAWIEKKLAEAMETKLAGQETAIEAYAYLAKGNQTRSRRALAKAEEQLVSARDLFKRVRRAAGPGDTAEQCQREMKDADRRMVDLLTRWGELEVGNRSWKRASAAVDRGLRIDPVDSALLELRRKIDENWIRRKASDISNARGRQSSQ